MAMAQICELQQQYGKTPANLKVLVDGFLWVLKDYPMNAILDAIAEYVKRNNNIPSPSDIVNIIDPPEEIWKPTWPVYIAMKKKIQQEYYYPSVKEREYLKRCERYAMDSERIHTDDREELQARDIAAGRITFQPEEN